MTDTEKLFRVEKCEFALKCPKHWNDLDVTEDEGIRHCRFCERNVYLCVSQTEFISYANLGRCVAVRDQSEEGESAYIVGEPSGASYGTVRQSISQES